MSHDNPTSPPNPNPGEATREPPSPAREAAPAPQPPPAAPVLVSSPAVFHAARPRPVLGPSLSVFGVMLWSYVVFGQFTTSWLPGGAPLGEGTAVFFVFVASVVAWVLAVRRSLVVSVRGQQGIAGRAIRIGVLAWAWWLVTVVLASLFGQASGKNLDGPITGLLVLLSAFAVVQGRRLTLPERPPLTQRERVIARLLWAGAAAMTLAACVELAAGS